MDVLNLSVSDSFLITESVSVIDLVVEVGVVADSVSIVEDASALLDVLNLSVFDTISIAEYGNVFPPIYLSAFDTITIVEDIENADSAPCASFREGVVARLLEIMDALLPLHPGPAQVHSDDLEPAVADEIQVLRVAAKVDIHAEALGNSQFG